MMREHFSVSSVNPGRALAALWFYLSYKISKIYNLKNLFPYGLQNAGRRKAWIPSPQVAIGLLGPVHFTETPAEGNLLSPAPAASGTYHVALSYTLFRILTSS